MALSTFGAIMGFAAEMAGQTKVTYEALSEKAKDAALKEVLQQLAVEEGKTHSLMERTRREHVTEMILEPITGLYKKDYELDLRHGEQKDDADVLKVALMLEEVARIFRKISRKKEETLERLRAHA
jgi:hypothetical protein